MAEATPVGQETSAISSGAGESTGAPITAATASTDPIRSNETSALAPESRPELAETVEPTQETPSNGHNVTNVPKEEKLGKGEVLIESHPINEGVLNHKGPGLKGLIYSKKYFWFHDQPMEQKHLASYIGSEKAKDIAHGNAAHASVTGKGLLFFAKRAEDKDDPQGIMNLADMSEVSKGNFNDFSIKIHGHKHLFQATNKAERDGWIVALETKMTEAKSSRGAVMDSAGYKSALEGFGKPTAAGSATGTSRSLSRPKKTSKSQERMTNDATLVDKKKDENVHHKTDVAPVSVDSAVGGNTTSTSAATPADLAPTTDGATNTTPGPTTSHKNGEHTAEAAAGTAAGAVAVSEAKHHGSTSDEEKNKKKSRSQSRGNKRSSIFGGLLGKKDEKKEEKEEKNEIKKEEKAEKQELKKEEKAERKEEKAEDKAILKEIKHEEKAEKKAEKEDRKEEKASEKELKHEGSPPAGDFDAAAIASRVVGAPLMNTEGTSTTNGIETSSVPVTETTPTSTVRDSGAKPNKRNSLFGSLFNKKDTTTPTTTETAAPVATKDEPSTVANSAPQLENPVVPSTTESQIAPTGNTNEVSAAPTTEAAAPVSATTPTDKRRTSFFSNLGTKKEKRTGGTSDTELTDGEGKKSSGGLGGLLRKASRAQPRHKADAPATSAADVPLPKESAAAAEPTTNGESAAVKSELTDGEPGSSGIANAEHQTAV